MGNKSYADPSFGVKQTITLPSIETANQTSAIASATVFSRATLMQNVTIKDFNVHFLAACTASGATTEAWRVALAYSSAGTGTVTAIGTATVGSATAIAANGVQDGAVTETDLASGDDLIAEYLAGSALPAGVTRISHVDVSFVEHFV